MHGIVAHCCIPMPDLFQPEGSKAAEGTRSAVRQPRQADDHPGAVTCGSDCSLDVIGTTVATPLSVAYREMTTTGRRFQNSGRCRHSGGG